MPIKYNPFTGRYEYAEEDQDPVQNEYEGGYEMGRQDEASFSPFTLRYSKKGNRLVDKWNPYKGRYEQVPEDWGFAITPTAASTSSVQRNNLLEGPGVCSLGCGRTG